MLGSVPGVQAGRVAGTGILPPAGGPQCDALKSTKGIGPKLQFRNHGEWWEGRLERGRPGHLGPHGLGKGFGFYSKYVWQLLDGFEGHTPFSCFKKDDSGCSV